MTDILNQLAPLKTIQVSHNNTTLWFDHELRQQMKQRLATTANTCHNSHQHISRVPHLPDESVQQITIASYNCFNFKTSYLLSQHLIARHHIVFIAEHWLASEDAIVVKEALSTSYNSVFISHFSLSDGQRGRPPLALAVDYAMVSASTARQVQNFAIVDDARDTSDHKPISSLLK